jgi:hypothetical protein
VSSSALDVGGILVIPLYMQIVHEPTDAVGFDGRWSSDERLDHLGVISGPGGSDRSPDRLGADLHRAVPAVADHCRHQPAAMGVMFARLRPGPSEARCGCPPVRRPPATSVATSSATFFRLDRRR